MDSQTAHWPSTFLLQAGANASLLLGWYFMKSEKIPPYIERVGSGIILLIIQYNLQVFFDNLSISKKSVNITFAGLALAFSGPTDFLFIFNLYAK